MYIIGFNNSGLLNDVQDLLVYKARYNLLILS